MLIAVAFYNEHDVGRSKCTDSVGDADVGEKRKKSIQRKMTSFTVVCNLNPNPEDYLSTYVK